MTAARSGSGKLLQNLIELLEAALPRYGEDYKQQCG